MLTSADDDDRQCNIRLSGFGHTLICQLPAIIQPWRIKVKPRSWDAATIARLGRDWYHDVHRREFGFSLSGTGMVDGCVALHLHYGPQTHDSRTTKSKCWFLPWTQWRHVRHSLYGLNGEFFTTIPEKGTWTDHRDLVAGCPTRTLSFLDFDGEALTARTRIEEREWRHGKGWFKWLSWFRNPKIQRSLDIKFSGETGDRKGSWKGGTVGHSISMLPGELHESAFRRYCGEHSMTFMGEA
jgi:hypothetical protein